MPTPEQIESVLERSPVATVIERRNRAIVAFTWLTGVRDGALVTLKLRHVDLAKQLVDQDPREVKTKNSKQLRTTFFGVGGSAQRIVEEWIAELRRDHLWGNDDPLFPATAIGQDSEQQFAAVGLARAHWATADAVQKIFKQLFEGVGLHGFNPHSFRHALAALGERTCQNPEEFKAWSQNLGHEGVLTTFSSYGPVPSNGRPKLIKRWPSGRNSRHRRRRVALSGSMLAGCGENCQTSPGWQALNPLWGFRGTTVVLRAAQNIAQASISARRFSSASPRR